ncbi:alpha-D-glucose phosphate-specific phosphoglucomutase [Prochlorococcus sp. AH-736-L19]|nr:alpha-D-glucose phosphate-specific phosphoglucomutase [Prochlorococcus sp. AH-736-L19]MDA9704093.1 alpha-D-glucose phosphate-specific phosphoglucomutase [Prochlorococcus sp. AH-736-L19]
MTQVSVININSPFLDQKPGTSGLRKSTLKFQEEHYLEVFIEAILQSLEDLKGSTLVVGGDGRYGNIEAIKKIIQICIAHKVQKVIVPKYGLLSTPATSHLIRKENAIGGIILSASHNPGGIDGDFGVKLNISNGGPAPEIITNKIFKASQLLTSYKICKIQLPDLSEYGTFPYGETTLEIIDGLKDYSNLMEKIFDFDQISDFLKKDFSLIFDAMNAVTGPYAKNIFVEKMGLAKDCVMNGNPLKDFGGLHPDPNLTYASHLADLLLNKKSYSFGAACDGDGDRNMILGSGCFVNPSDSLAVITANTKCVPGYKDGITGVARSMPTSSAVDNVARALNIPCFETPTGWKFFGNLLDSNLITLCGEESFGTGSNHVREKDGLWAVLYWLQVLAEKKCSVSDLMQNHWKLAKEMLQSMYAAKGIGLAAPQIGINKELLVIDVNFEDSAAEPLILINPEITDYGTTLNSYEEGCLSIPGVYLNVVRPSTIKLKFRDEMGRPRKMKADGLLARCIQHEMDHLNGILFVDRVTSKDDLNKELKKEGFNEKDVISIS